MSDTISYSEFISRVDSVLGYSELHDKLSAFVDEVGEDNLPGGANYTGYLDTMIDSSGNVTGTAATSDSVAENTSDEIITSLDTTVNMASGGTSTAGSAYNSSGGIAVSSGSGGSSSSSSSSSSDSSSSDNNTKWGSTGNGTTTMSGSPIFTSDNDYVKSFGFDKICFPGPNNTVTSHYLSTNRGAGASNPHVGTDYRAARGAALFAVCDGEVSSTAEAYHGILLKSKTGINFRYLHCDTHICLDGNGKRKSGSIPVKAGDVIGSAGGWGSKGRGSYSPHLHFDLLCNKDIGTKKKRMSKVGMSYDSEEFFSKAGMNLVYKAGS